MSEIKRMCYAINGFARRMMIASAGLFLLLLPACGGGLLGNLEPAKDSIDNAIVALNSNSSNWQDVLAKLERDLTVEGKSIIANEVTQLAQRGVAVTGTEIKCSADFVGNRMKQGLLKLKAGGAYVPDPPSVCQVVPAPYKLDHCDGHVDFYGYDFDAEPLIVKIKKTDGTYRDVSAKTSLPTHYLMVLDTSRFVLDSSDERIELYRKSSPEPLHSVGIVRPQPPTPPVVPQRREQFVHSGSKGVPGGVFGANQDVTFGRDCSPGFHRVQCTAAKTSIDGSCEVKSVPDDPRDCRCTVNFKALGFQGIDCLVRIVEREDDPPPWIPPVVSCGTNG